MELGGKTAMVTGGAGFIGSTLSEYLLRLGCKVISFDNFDDFYQGKEQNLAELQRSSRFKLIRNTILDTGALDSAMKGVDLVFHLAAQPGVRYCIDHPEKAHATNATGTFNVLMASKKNGVSKVVYASSSSVYGDPVKVPMEEAHPQHPGSPYAASKLAGEKYCLAFSRTYNMDIACLRYFSVYGPRGRPDQVLSSFASAAANGSQPTIFGDGKNSRDFTFVSDVVEATVLSAMVNETRGEVLNIGFGKEVKIGYAAEKVLRHFKAGFGPKFVPGYSGDFSRTISSSVKAQRLLGWKPRVGFDEGLDKFLQWFDERSPETDRGTSHPASMPQMRPEK